MRIGIKGLRAFAFGVLAVMAWSCTLVELQDFRDEEDAWVSPVPLTGRLYTVGAEWEKGYDWHQDPTPGEVACSLVVWVDGRIVIRVPAGPGYGVDPGPESFRLISGKLYTLGTLGKETVVKVNGKELFRYPGRETLVEMAVEGEEVYTLTNSCSGQGCALRKNGAVLFEDKEGIAYPHMEGGEGTYTFTYRHGDDEEQQDYFCYDGKKAFPADLPPETFYVEDLLLHEDKVAAFLWIKGHDDPVLLDDHRLNWLKMEEDVYGHITWCRLTCSETGKLAACGSFGMCTTAFWMDGEHLASYIGYSAVWGMQVAGGELLAYQKVHPLFPKTDSIFWKNKSISLPAGYTSYGWKPVCLWQGKVYAALTPERAGQPVIWTEAGSQEIGINGCLFEIGVSD